MKGSTSSNEVKKELKLNPQLQQDTDKKKKGVYKNFISGVKNKNELKITKNL